MASAAKEASAEWRKLLSSHVLKKINIEQLTVANEMTNAGGGFGGFAGIFSSQNMPKRNSCCDYFIFSKIKQDTMRKIINAASSNDITVDRAIGSVVGMGLGDAFGAPLEFRSCLECVMNDKESLENSEDSEQPKAELKILTRKDKSGTICNELEYIYESNKFRLSRGQWTDDASMGLCMADSLIIHEIYDGSDIRVRFYNWWHNGYNNAFRNDKDRAKIQGGQGSVGLGGNISQSIYSMEDYVYPTPIYEVDHDREDSGNGSIMRLAPVPVFFHGDINLAREYASQSSFTTHPGYIAAECCSFMSFIIIRAIHAPQTRVNSNNNNNNNNSNSNDNSNDGNENKEEKQDSNVAVDTLVPRENVKLWIDLITKEYYGILTNEIEQLKNQVRSLKKQQTDKKDNKNNDKNNKNNDKNDVNDNNKEDDDVDMTGGASNKKSKEKSDEADEKSDGNNDNNNDSDEVKLIKRLINAKKLILQLIDCENCDKHPKELNWNWKLGIDEYKKIMIETYHNRKGNKLQDGKWKWGRKMYNGYPVSATYWGSYCMDGIAMGLHGVYNSKNFAHAIQICVNLLGDADSTGSIGGQIAGSIYGYQSLLNDNEYGGKRMVELLNKWDDQGFAFRGLLLYEKGLNYKENNQQDKQRIETIRNKIQNDFNKDAAKKGGKKRSGWASKPQE